MRTALIGHTGFVGSNLARQHPFSHTYRSTTIGEIDGQAFDLVVCAGVSASKWIANNNPEADWAAIDLLINHLERVSASHVVLISTVDVYPSSVNVDERTVPTEDNHAYGKHRLRLETFIKERFPQNTILRLPALFGEGLKKNVLFDLLHNNCLEKINPASAFQYYDLSLLWKDIERIRQAGLPLVNITTAPIATQEILARFFPAFSPGATPMATARYDIRTIHDRELGGTNGYLYDQNVIFSLLETFIQKERSPLSS